MFYLFFAKYHPQNPERKLAIPTATNVSLNVSNLTPVRYTIYTAKIANTVAIAPAIKLFVITFFHIVLTLGSVLILFRNINTKPLINAIAGNK